MVDRTQTDLVCVSHLWWDWVWQRPQQLMSRLARHARVFWVEEPRLGIGPPGEGFEFGGGTIHHIPSLRHPRRTSA